MNIIFIYDGNDYQFDIPSNVSIKYIQKLAQRIFQYEEKGYDLLFNEENLNNYDENFKINQLVNGKENNLIFHLEKKDLTVKNTLVSSNESTNDSNYNDKYFHLMRKKFYKFNTIYSKIIEEISTFEERLEEILESIKKHINDFKINILNVNETLHYFYNSDSYNKLVSIFEELQPQGLNKKDLEHLNKEIDSYILNYKYLITQHNFQTNILDFLIEKKDIFKFAKIELFKVDNHNNYEEIVLFLEQFFSELTTSNYSKNPLSKDSGNFHYTKGSFSNIREKNRDLSFPKINIKSNRESSPNIFCINSEKRKSVNINKLIKKNKSIISQNNQVSSIFKRINKSENHFLNNFPILDNESLEGKTFELTHFLDSNSNESKLLKSTNKSSYLITQYNSKYKSNPKIKDLDTISFNNEVKPKIMEKNNHRLKQRNYQNMEISVNKTMNNIHNNFEFSHIYEKKEKKKISLNDSVNKDKINSKSLKTERTSKERILDKNLINNKNEISSIIKEKDIEKNLKNVKNEIIKDKELDKSFKIKEKKRNSRNDKNCNDLDKSLKNYRKERSSKTEGNYNKKDLDKNLEIIRKERSSKTEGNYKERKKKTIKKDKNIIEKELDQSFKSEIIHEKKDKALKLKEEKKCISVQVLPFINNNKQINTDIKIEKNNEKEIKSESENKQHKEKEKIEIRGKMELSLKEELKKKQTRISTILINPPIKTEFSLKEIKNHRKLSDEKLSEPSNPLKSNLKKIGSKEEIKQRNSKIINFINNSEKKDGKDELIGNFIQDETNKSTKDKFERRKSHNSKKTYKTDINQIENNSNFIQKNEKENNENHIEKLTKDLLPKNNYKVNNPNKEISKNNELKEFIRHTLNLNKSEKDDKNKKEEETLLNEEEIEDNEKFQKKKRKHINKYDFII